MSPSSRSIRRCRRSTASTGGAREPGRVDRPELAGHHRSHRPRGAARSARGDAPHSNDRHARSTRAAAGHGVTPLVPGSRGSARALVQRATSTSCCSRGTPPRVDAQLRTQSPRSNRCALRWSERREATSAALIAAMQSQPAIDLMRRWRAWVGEPSEHERSGQKGEHPLGKVVAKRIDRLQSRVVEGGRSIGEDCPVDFVHDVRKDAKKLRYMFECFGNLVPKKPRAEFIRRLKSIQDGLGELPGRRGAHRRGSFRGSRSERWRLLGRDVACHRSTDRAVRCEAPMPHSPTSSNSSRPTTPGPPARPCDAAVERMQPGGPLLTGAGGAHVGGVEALLEPVVGIGLVVEGTDFVDSRPIDTARSPRPDCGWSRADTLWRRVRRRGVRALTRSADRRPAREHWWRPTCA